MSIRTARRAVSKPIVAREFDIRKWTPEEAAVVLLRYDGFALRRDLDALRRVFMKVDREAGAIATYMRERPDDDPDPFVLRVAFDMIRRELVRQAVGLFDTGCDSGHIFDWRSALVRALLYSKAATHVSANKFWAEARALGIDAPHVTDEEAATAAEQELGMSVDVRRFRDPARYAKGMK
ncbi:MAG: hypothetical protein NTV22_09775 [bacterium]|nr:hypothetical protein [bacterium]